MVFLSRHDKGHRLSPSDINYRANIDVLKRAGVTDLVSLSACGSFKEELAPGTFVLIDQFVDRTHKRESSFFGKGCVAHVSMAHPVSPRLRIHLAAAAEAEGIRVVRDGTYVCMEGPQFSTLAESLTYKKLGYSVIGMTNMPEAKLAREAEICYATVAMVTDYDCWHPDHDAVTVQDIIKVLTANADKAKRLVARLAQRFSARARAVPDRLRPRARHRADHGAGGARRGAAEEARRGGGAGCSSACSVKRKRGISVRRYDQQEMRHALFPCERQTGRPRRRAVSNSRGLLGTRARIHAERRQRARDRRKGSASRRSCRTG